MQHLSRANWLRYSEGKLGWHLGIDARHAPPKTTETRLLEAITCTETPRGLGLYDEERPERILGPAFYHGGQNRIIPSTRCTDRVRSKLYAILEAGNYLLFLPCAFVVHQCDDIERTPTQHGSQHTLTRHETSPSRPDWKFDVSFTARGINLVQNCGDSYPYLGCSRTIPSLFCLSRDRKAPLTS